METRDYPGPDKGGQVDLKGPLSRGTWRGTVSDRHSRNPVATSSRSRAWHGQGLGFDSHSHAINECPHCILGPLDKGVNQTAHIIMTYFESHFVEPFNFSFL